LHAFIQRRLSIVTKRRVTKIMGKSRQLHYVRIYVVLVVAKELGTVIQPYRNGLGDLRDFQRMSKPITEKV
jgi:hypothetical protein